MFGLETDRLIVRCWTEDDRPAFMAMMTNPEVTRYIGSGKTFTDQDATDFFARQARQLAEHDVCMGAVVEKSTGRVIGIAGVQPLGTTPDLEIGWIFSPDCWGRGYATEAGAAAMRHVLETLGRPRVMAIIDPPNDASKRVAARLGMTCVGRFTGQQLGHRNPGIVVDLFSREK